MKVSVVNYLLNIVFCKLFAYLVKVVALRLKLCGIVNRYAVDIFHNKDGFRRVPAHHARACNICNA